MTPDEFIYYWYPAAKNLNVSTEKLGKLICTNEMIVYLHSSPHLLDRFLNEELRNLLEHLKGPHAKTILKAYRIKKGLE
jgi:hypothetical protein